MRPAGQFARLGNRLRGVRRIRRIRPARPGLLAATAALLWAGGAGLADGWRGLGWGRAHADWSRLVLELAVSLCGFALALWLATLRPRGAAGSAPGAAPPPEAAPSWALAPPARSGLLLALLLGSAALGVLTLEVLRGGGLAAADRAVTAAFVAARRPALTHSMIVLTWLGSFLGLAAAVLAAGLGPLLRRGDPSRLALAGAALVGAVSLNGAFKALVARPRPEAGLGLSWAIGSAFPSGHATAAVATLGMLAVLLGTGRGAWARFALAAVAGLLAAAVGLSRVYLGVHWLSDVLGGWLLGLLWLLGIRLWLGGRREPAGGPSP